MGAPAFKHNYPYEDAHHNVENTNEYTFLEPYQLSAYMCTCIFVGPLSVVRIYKYAWFLEP